MGLMRGREFGMTDLYSFDADPRPRQEPTTRMYDAYKRIFAALRRARRAGAGRLRRHRRQGQRRSSSSSTEIGEDDALLCPNCDYAANAEKAEFRKPAAAPRSRCRCEEVATPGQKTIDELGDVPR